MAKNNLSQWTLALLRVVLGIIFLYHGYAKLFVPGVFGGTVGFFAAINIPLPAYAALGVSVAEFLGGIFLLLGMVTKWTAAILIIEMLVAFFKVHFKQGFFIAPQSYGYEFVLLILAALIVVLVNGAGKLALGRMFRNKFLH